MSDSPFWSLNFDLRPDLPDHVMRALTAVALDSPPDDGALMDLPKVVRYYLADWRRMLGDEDEPLIGSPIRLYRSGRAASGELPPMAISVEFGVFDDTFGDGGWVLLFWLLSLALRSQRLGRTFVGSVRRFERDTEAGDPLFIDSRGVDVRGKLITFAEIDADLEAERQNPRDYLPWNAWRR